VEPGSLSGPGSMRFFNWVWAKPKRPWVAHWTSSLTAILTAGKDQQILLGMIVSFDGWNNLVEDFFLLNLTHDTNIKIHEDIKLFHFSYIYFLKHWFHTYFQLEIFMIRFALF
jgi:hypothetical protein